MTNALLISVLLGETLLVLLVAAAVALGDWQAPRTKSLTVHARSRYRRRI